MNVESAGRELIETHGVSSSVGEVKRKGPRLRRYGVADGPVVKTFSASRNRCKCGECATCKENARWERIFVEKFADPEYYSRRLTVIGSSLAAWK